jgi:conjugal transfer mating pair stabilization protein TraG
MFDIVVLGDVNALSDVFNALAMVFASGSMRGLVLIGFLVGLILMGWQTVTSMDLGRPLLGISTGFILYLIAFVPTTTVTLESIRSGEVRQVANVPLGVAVTGSIMSHLGLYLTRELETAFGVPGITDTEVDNPMAVLRSVALTSFSRTALGAANEPLPGMSFWDRWVRYIQDCTTTMITRQIYDDGSGAKRENELQSMDDALEAVRFQHVWYGTDAVGGATILSCHEAWLELATFTKTEFLPAYYERRLAPVLGFDATGSGPEARALLQAALQSVTRLGYADDIDPDAFVLSTLLVNIYNEGVAQRFMQEGHFTEATATQDAIRQRNAQWSAERNMFTNSMDFIITFVEMFAFAVTLFLPFILALGASGQRLLPKYFILYLWINLWYPTIAIIRLYSASAMSRVVSRLEDVEQLPLTSLLGVMRFEGSLADQMAVTDMLMAATPMLALTLVTGGAIATSALAGRMQSADHYDEQRPAPALTAGTPMVASETPFTQNAFGVVSRTNVGSAMPEIEVGYAASRSTAVQEQEALRASQGLATSLQHAMSDSRSVTDSSGFTRAYGNTFMADEAKTWQVARAEVERIASQHGITDQKAINDATAATIAANVGAGQLARVAAGIVSLGRSEALFGTKLGERVAGALDVITGTISGSAQNTDSTSSSIAKTLADEASRTLSSDEGVRLAEAMAYDLNSSAGRQLTSTFGASHQEAVSQSASEVRERSEALQRAEAFSSTFSSGKRMDVADLAGKVLNAPEARQALDRAVVAIGDPAQPALDDVARDLDRNPNLRGSMSDAQAETAAKLLYLQNLGRASLSTDVQANAVTALSGVIGQALPGVGMGARPTLDSPAPDAPQFGAIHSEADRIRGATESRYGGLAGAGTLRPDQVAEAADAYTSGNSPDMPRMDQEFADDARRRLQAGRNPLPNDADFEQKMETATIIQNAERERIEKSGTIPRLWDKFAGDGIDQIDDLAEKSKRHVTGDNDG